MNHRERATHVTLRNGRLHTSSAYHRNDTRWNWEHYYYDSSRSYTRGDWSSFVSMFPPASRERMMQFLITHGVAT